MRKKSLFFIFLVLNGCQAYVDSSREAGVPFLVGRSKPERVAICYHPWRTKDDELMKMASEECAKIGGKPIPSEREKMTCRLMTPSVAYFDCKK